MVPSDSGSVLMTVAQVAAYLQLNKLTVYRYIRERRIPAAKLGKAYRLRKVDVDAFLERHMMGHEASVERRPSKGAEPAAKREWDASSLVSVAPAPRKRQEPDFQVFINPMDWVIRGLH